MEHKAPTLPILKALADHARLAIVKVLAAQPNDAVQGCDIAATCSQWFKVSQPTMSHHFSKLVEAGVVLEQKDGTSKSYQLNSSYLLEHGIDIDKL